MTLTPEQAAAVARQRGLSLSDAVAILRLATTVEEAEGFADTFADPKPRQLTREDLGKMGPAQINEARENGQLADLLNAGAQ